MSDEDASIPIAVGQDVNVESGSLVGKIFGTIIYIVIFGLIAYGVYYYFFRRTAALVTNAATAAAAANAVGSSGLSTIANVAASSPALGKFANMASNAAKSGKMCMGGVCIGTSKL